MTTPEEPVPQIGPVGSPDASAHPDAALAAQSPDEEFVTPTLQAPSLGPVLYASARPAASKPAPAKWMIIVPIVLMVLSALGIGGTLLYAHSQASAVYPGAGAGRTPGQWPSGFPTDFTPGQRPSGFPTGNYTPGQRPSGFPTDFTPGQRSGPANRAVRPMTLTGLEIGGLVACGIVFLGSTGLLIWTLVTRRRPVSQHN